MSREHYLSVTDGQLVWVTENDGYSLASRGPERQERPVRLEDLSGERLEEAKALLRAEKTPSQPEAGLGVLLVKR